MPVPMIPLPITATPGIMLDALHDRRRALTAADAHRREAVLALEALEDRDAGPDDPDARHAERVPERDRAAEDVQALELLLPAALLDHVERLRREGLVELDRVEVVEREVRARE